MRFASILGLALAAAASVLPAAGQTRGEAFAPSGQKSLETIGSVAMEGRDAASIVAEWNSTLTQAFGWQADAVADLQARIARLPPSALAELAGLQTWSEFTGTLLALETSRLAVAGGRRVVDQRDPNVATAIRAAQKSLGDQNRDLTFIPVQPCRIFDTRFEALGNPYNGRYTGANTKNFWAFTVNADGGDFSAYGGNTGCAELSTVNTATLNGTAPYAVMIKLTVVGPAAAGAYVSAVRSGDTNQAPALVSAYCDMAGGAPCFATVVVPVCRGTTGCAGTRDISILSNMQLDLAGEVFGYFIKPQATPLDCTEATTDIVTAAGVRSFTTVACPAGYTVTGGGVQTGTNDLQTVNASAAIGTTGWFSSITNNGAGSKTYTFSAHCCRVPGRP